VVKVKPLPGAIRDRSGAWAVSASVDEEVDAVGSVLEPMTPQDDIAFESINVPTMITVGCLVFVLLLCCVGLRFLKGRHHRFSMDRVAPRPLVLLSSAGSSNRGMFGVVNNGPKAKLTPTHKHHRPSAYLPNTGSVVGRTLKSPPSAKQNPRKQPSSAHSLATAPLPPRPLLKASSSVASNINGFYICQRSSIGSTPSAESLDRLARYDSRGADHDSLRESSSVRLSEVEAGTWLMYLPTYLSIYLSLSLSIYIYIYIYIYTFININNNININIYVYICIYIYIYIDLHV